MRAIVACAGLVLLLAGCPCKAPDPPAYALTFHSVAQIARERDGGPGDVSPAIDTGTPADGAVAEDAAPCVPFSTGDPLDPQSGSGLQGTVFEIGSGCNADGWLFADSRFRNKGCDFWVDVLDRCGEHWLLEGSNLASISAIHGGDAIAVKGSGGERYPESTWIAPLGAAEVRAADGTLLLFWMAMDDLRPPTFVDGVDVALGSEVCEGGCSYHYNLIVTYQGEQGEVPYAQSRQIGGMVFQHLAAYVLSGPDCELGGGESRLELMGYRVAR